MGQWIKKQSEKNWQKRHFIPSICHAGVYHESHSFFVWNSPIILIRVTWRKAIYLYFLVSSGKKPIISFQHIVIHVLWKNTRLLHLSLALYSDLDGIFSQSWVISERTCTYWLFYKGRCTYTCSQPVTARYNIGQPRRRVACPTLATTANTAKQP